MFIFDVEIKLNSLKQLSKIWTKIVKFDEILHEIGDSGWTKNVILDNVFLECL